MATKNVDDQMDRSPGNVPATSGGSDGQSDADFGNRMEASEEQTERYADIEDTDREGEDVSTYDAETRNTPGAIGAYAGTSRHS